MRESELRQETKVSEIRRMLQRKKGLQKQEICRTRERKLDFSLTAEQYV